jgi:NAD(P)H dehydrogenase (quinone)
MVTPAEHTQVLLDAGTPEFMAHFAAELDENIEEGHLADATGTMRTLIGRPTTSLIDALRATTNAVAS